MCECHASNVGGSGPIHKGPKSAGRRPKRMFADSHDVMIAKMSVVQSTADRMKELCGSWLDENYGARVETLYWTLWSRRKAGLRPATQLR